MILTCLYIFSSARAMFPEEAEETKFKATTITFTAFVFLQLWNAINCRSRNTLLPVAPFSNKFFNFAVGGSALMQLAVVYLPFFNYIFETQPLTLPELLQAILLPVVVILVDEVWKRIKPSTE